MLVGDVRALCAAMFVISDGGLSGPPAVSMDDDGFAGPKEEEERLGASPDIVFRFPSVLCAMPIPPKGFGKALLLGEGVSAWVCTSDVEGLSADVPNDSPCSRGDRRFNVGESEPLLLPTEWLRDPGGEDEIALSASEPRAEDLGKEKGKRGAYADVLCIGGVGIDKLRMLVVGEVLVRELVGL